MTDMTCLQSTRRNTMNINTHVGSRELMTIYDLPNIYPSISHKLKLNYYIITVLETWCPQVIFLLDVIISDSETDFSLL